VPGCREYAVLCSKVGVLRGIVSAQRVVNRVRICAWMERVCCIV